MKTRPKDQGTKRETCCVNDATARGFTAQRSPNNAASRDVDLTVGENILRVEVKDRERLNLHQTVRDAEDANPDNPTAVYWHRYTRNNGNKRRTSMGTVWVFPEDIGWRLLALANEHGAFDD